MVDPTALYNGALAVYGEAAMARDYGQLVGVDAARASPTHDGMTMHVGTRCLHFADTPGPCTAPPLHLGRGLGRLVHRRHLRPELPRIRPAARAVDPAQFDAGAVRPAGAACIDRAAAANEAPLHVPDALRPHRPGRALGRRLAGRAARHGGCRPGESARRRAPRPAARGPVCPVPAIAARTWLRVPGRASARRCWRWTWNSTRRAWVSGSIAVEGGRWHVEGEFRSRRPRGGHHRRGPGHRRGLRAPPGAATAQQSRCGTWTTCAARRWRSRSARPAGARCTCTAMCRSRPRSTPRWPPRWPRSAACDGLVNNAGIFKARRLSEHQRSRLGRGDRRQPEGCVPGRPGGGAAHGRARRRRHRAT